MVVSIPTTEPQAARAGDTWSWTRALADRPAPIWGLSYTLFASAGVISFSATADGATHRVNLAPSVTAAYAPGRYDWIAQVSDGTDRHQVGRGVIDILPDIGATAICATLETGSVGANNALSWAAVIPGSSGNAISVSLTQGTALNIPLGIMVATIGTAPQIRATLATDGSGNPDTTAMELASAIAAMPAAAVLVTCAQGAGSDGSGLVFALAATNLTGGTSAPAAYDGRSHARRMLASINAMLESRATSGDLDLVKTAFGARAAEFDLAALMKLRQQYAAAVAAEDAAERLARGEPSGRFISTRFCA